MIRQITGQLIDIEQKKKDYVALVQLGGITYELYIPGGMADKLKAIAAQHLKENTPAIITLHTIHYLEGNMGGGPMIPRLVGFLDSFDRDFFELFSSVGGLGIKTALKAMVVPVNDIARAIEQEDAAWLDALPEIGAATAKKIIAELKGKMAKFALMKNSPTAAPPDFMALDIREEALSVLLQLQYNKSEAEMMIQKALARNKKIKDSEALIAEIFKQQKDDR
jgi:Holliday junction DNA helicase RuvA